MNHTANLVSVDSPASISSWIWLDMGTVTFLLPPNNILTLASTNQFIPVADTQPQCGTLMVEQNDYPVFLFTKSLQLQHEWDEEHDQFVVLQHEDYCFALACIEIKKIVDVIEPRFSVPIAMSSRKQPFNEFTLIQNRVAGITNAEKLFQLLQSRGAILSNYSAQSFSREVS